MSLAGHNRGKHYRPGKGYVRGKIALRVLLADKGYDIKCPFCKTYTNSENSLHFCAGCGRPWFEKRDGNFVFEA